MSTCHFILEIYLNIVFSHSRYSFDLQTFSLQKPSSKGKKLPPEYTKIGCYPVAVLPGQYTDYFRE